MVIQLSNWWYSCIKFQCVIFFFKFKIQLKCYYSNKVQYYTKGGVNIINAHISCTRILVVKDNYIFLKNENLCCCRGT